MDTKKTKGKIADINPSVSLITINVNILNNQSKD